MPSMHDIAVLRAVMPCEFWYGATGMDLAHGLRACDWDIQQIDMRHYFNAASSKPAKARARLLQPLARRYYNAAILRAVDEVDAQVLLTVKGVAIEPATLAACRARDVLCVNFYPDVAFNHAGISEERLCDYQLVTTTKTYHIAPLRQSLGATQVHHIPHGYSDLIRRDRAPMNEDDYLWDVAYVGNASPHKFTVLLALREALPDISMLVAGSGWERLAAGTALATDVIGFGLTGDYLAAISYRSRINVAVHFGVTNQQGWEDFVSRRTFEIPAFGGFMLHVDNSEVRGLYAVSEEIDVFGTPGELVAQVRRYLPDPARRAAMIARAAKRAVPAYGYATRARALDLLVRDALAGAA